MMPQSFEVNYMPVTVQDIRTAGYAPSVDAAANCGSPPDVRPCVSSKAIPVGQNHRAVECRRCDQAERVLYVTYSRDLASLAREYFDRFCSSHKQFQVVVFPHLVRQVLGLETTLTRSRSPGPIQARSGPVRTELGLGEQPDRVLR